jgi:hypothetical protein
MFARITIQINFFLHHDRSPRLPTCQSTSSTTTQQEAVKMSKLQMFDSVPLNQNIQLHADGIAHKGMKVGL